MRCKGRLERWLRTESPADDACHILCLIIPTHTHTHSHHCPQSTVLTGITSPLLTSRPQVSFLLFKRQTPTHPLVHTLTHMCTQESNTWFSAHPWHSVFSPLSLSCACRGQIAPMLNSLKDRAVNILYSSCCTAGLFSKLIFPSWLWPEEFTIMILLWYLLIFWCIFNWHN